MTRPLPRCAICGGLLRWPEAEGRGCRITLQFQGLPGSPTVGWHEDCSKTETGEDDVIAAIRPESRHGEDPTPLLRRIEARGPGRLVAGKGWTT